MKMSLQFQSFVTCFWNLKKFYLCNTSWNASFKRLNWLLSTDERCLRLPTSAFHSVAALQADLCSFANKRHLLIAELNELLGLNKRSKFSNMFRFGFIILPLLQGIEFLCSVILAVSYYIDLFITFYGRVKNCHVLKVLAAALNSFLGGLHVLVCTPTGNG